MMNVTEQLMYDIKSQYYWIDEEAGFFLARKDHVHVLIISVAITIIVCILLWYRTKKTL